MDALVVKLMIMTNFQMEPTHLALLILQNRIIKLHYL